MAIKNFAIEASHIIDVARSIGDDNQIYYDADYAKKTEPKTIIAPQPSFNRVRNSIPTTSCVRKPVRPGSVRARSRPGSSRRKAAAVVVAAAVCMPNSTTNITATSKSATC
jgi:hypothetical protein